MTSAIGSNALLPGNAGTAYSLLATAAKPAPSVGQAPEASSQQPASDSVTLSDAAKAYLAANAPTDAATLAASVRAWFDQQYQTHGIASAMLDGQVAVDMTSQSRAALSAVASNSQSLFTKDESAAAAQTLQARFDDSITPHVVIARHTSDYASLYQAAADYLNEAGADERATARWQGQNEAVMDGLAAAKSTFGKAPDTQNDNDPVRALLDRTSTSDPSAATTDAAGVAAKARAMLTAQANKALDAGTELVFDKARRGGRQADFSDFDNQSLAVVALNRDASFSSEEARAAKMELDQRNRVSMLNAFDSTKNGGGAQGASLALLQQYSTMSDAEKSVLGYNDDFKDQIIQNYRAISMLESAAGGSSSPGLGSLI